MANVTNVFAKTLTKEHFGLISDVQVFAGKYNEIGRYRVPAQQIVCWGSRSLSRTTDIGEPIQIVLKDSNGNEIKGWIRLKVADANNVNTRVLLEERSEKFTVPVTDRDNAIKLPQMKPCAREDSYLIIEFKPDSDATISASNSTIIAPVTVFTL
jgi:hypothetical protein